VTGWSGRCRLALAAISSIQHSTHPENMVVFGEERIATFLEWNRWNWNLGGHIVILHNRPTAAAEHRALQFPANLIEAAHCAWHQAQRSCKTRKQYCSTATPGSHSRLKY